VVAGTTVLASVRLVVVGFATEVEGAFPASRSLVGEVSFSQFVAGTKDVGAALAIVRLVDLGSENHCGGRQDK
jgi:hypothetical protein